MNNTSQRAKGIIMIISGAMLWGATGPMMEWVLSSTSISVSFMLTVRLVLAGLMLLGFLSFKRVKIFSIWKNKYWLLKLITFGIFGMLGVQYTFVAAIDASNAVLATLLQFLAPIFIMLYISFSQRKLPPKYQVIGIVGTLLGLFLLLTNGSLTSLLVSNSALLWGLGVGLTFSFYTLYPTSLMNEWGVLIVVGWGMLIGGLVLGIFNGFWKFDDYIILTQPTISAMLVAIIFFGTLAFVLFLGSMKHISPVETSILSSMEPLTAMFISVIWLNRTLEIWQIVGVICMISFVTWLSIEGSRRTKLLK
ncbi:MAG: EamA family transporter [Kurthia sp.]|nr:EamA family transporter [Candidatus Kurthia equi]